MKTKHLILLLLAAMPIAGCLSVPVEVDYTTAAAGHIISVGASTKGIKISAVGKQVIPTGK